MRSSGFCILCVLLMTAAPLAAQSRIGFTWGTSASSFGNQPGRRVSGYCPPGSPSRIWGSDVYTADSSICSAAVHAGVISATQGGIVTIVMQPGQRSYEGGSRNGVVSEKWAEFADSYTFDRTNHEADIDWTTTADGFDSETPVVLTCRGGGRLSDIWGTDLYTSDSSICTAAVHAGLIEARTGGRVKVARGTGAGCFTGTNRNGVESKTYGTCVGSFTVSAPGAVATTVPTRPVRPTPVAQPRALNTVTSLSIEPATLSLRHGDKSLIDAGALDANGNIVRSATIKWQSSDPSKVAVATDGTVTAMDVGGPVTVTASVDTLKATAAVTVTALPPSAGVRNAPGTQLGVISAGMQRTWTDHFASNGETQHWLRMTAVGPACASPGEMYHLQLMLKDIPADRNYDLLATTGGPAATQGSDPRTLTSKNASNQNEVITIPVPCGKQTAVDLIITRVSGLPSASRYTLQYGL